MAFSLLFQDACRRAKRMREFASEVVEGMLKPFSLKALYPLTKFTKKDGTEGWRHNILPHQQKIHDGITPSGKRATYTCFCVGGETVIGGRPVRDWVAEGVGPAYLKTIFGPSEPGVPFLKGQADLYRVRTLSGREVVVTGQHRFLGVSGWDRLDRLGVGALIAADGTWHGSQRQETPIGSRGCYSPGSRQDDGLPTPLEVAARSRLQQSRRTDGDNNARGDETLPSTDHCSRLTAWFRRWLGAAHPGIAGAFAPTLRQARPAGPLGQSKGRIRTERGPFRQVWDIALSALCLCGFRIVSGIVRQRSGECLTLWRQLAGYAVARMREVWGQGQRRILATCGSVADCPETFLHPPLSGAETQLLHGGRNVSRFPGGSSPSGNARQVVQWVLPPDKHTSFWDEIVSIEWDRYDDFYDITIPGAEHYGAEGLWHHNSGGAGVGKTLCLCAEALKLLKTYPGIKILYTAPFDWMFPEVVFPKWHDILDEEDPFIAEHNAKERWFRMVNGSEIRFHAYDDPEKVKGFEVHIIIIEEAAELCNGNNYLAHLMWGMFNARLRATPKEYPHRIYLDQNPRGHNWVWKVFIKSDPSAPQPLGDLGAVTRYGEVNRKGQQPRYHEYEKVTLSGEVFYSIACPSYANTHLTDAYLAGMEQAYATQAGALERMVEGLWSPVNTLAYEMPYYSEATHLVDYQAFLDTWEYDSIPNWLRVVVGIDVGGARSPWAIEYYLQSEGGEWICFDEVYEIQSDWGPVCDRIKAKEREYGFTNIQYWIDPYSSNTGGGPRSEMIKTEFQARGIQTDFPKGYNKTGGLARVRSYLKPDKTEPCPYIEDETEELDDGTVQYQIGKARLYYLTNVPGKPRNLVKEDKAIVVNAAGHAAPGNIQEKTVFRFDDTKQREQGAAEEGLSPKKSEKLMDRDDHAQTAEFFAFIGIEPLTREERHRGPIRKREQLVHYGKKSHKATR